MKIFSAITGQWLVLLLAMISSSAGFAHGGSHGAAVVDTAVDEPVATSATVSLMTTLGEVEQFTLGNGLRVIVHEDRKAPIVSVRVIYHVGSKQEPQVKTGFAHLFEHILFRGSENFSGDFYEVLNGAGASEVNGTTNNDMTTYYETVPTPALELALWLESDRMGYLLGAVTQEALDDERGIVQNEKREREGAPYGKSQQLAMQATFPVGHPYHHSVIGSMEDLNAASLEDVHAWFKQYYGAANALVVLAGDIDAATARPLMEKYFDDIEPGPPLVKMESWVPTRESNIRETMMENVGLAMVQRAWAVPEFASRDRALLSMTAMILGGDETSRLHKTLVDELELATMAGSFLQAGEIAGIFVISVNVKEGVDPQEVVRAVDAVVANYLKKGPTQKELDRFRREEEVSLVFTLESATAKSALWAEAALFAGDPGFVDQRREWQAQAKPEAVHRVAEKWLSTGYHQLTAVPYGGRRAGSSSLDRGEQPLVDNKLVLDFPTVQEAVLSNGMKVVLAERPGEALEILMTLPNASSRTSEFGITPGTAWATLALMNEGPEGMTAAAYADETTELGIFVSVGAGIDSAQAGATMMKKDLRKSLALWARMLRRPALREDDFERLRDVFLQGVKDRRARAPGVGSAIMTTLVYGEDHPYAVPRFDEEDTLKSLTIADLRAFHDAKVRPDDATVLVVGATSLAEIVAELEAVLGDWKPSGKISKASVPQIRNVPVPDKPRVVLVDQPGESQATILVGRVVPSATSKGSLNFDAAQYALAGDMSSRISANLRVDKGWAYFAGAETRDGLMQRLWLLETAVQVDKTSEAMLEILGELQAFSNKRPVTEAELSLFVRSEALELPSLLVYNTDVMGIMWESQFYDRPYDWIEGEKDRLDGLRLTDVAKAAQQYFKPETMTWVVVGDLAKIEQKIRDLDIGTVEVWNNKGEKIR